MQLRYRQWDSKSMAIKESDFPSQLVLRQVDDVPVVSPEDTSWGKKIFQNYKIEIC
jgi:hypothetical protein